MENIAVAVAVPIIVALISSAGFWQFFQKRFERKSIYSQALGALIRHQMWEIYETYKDKDSVPVDTLEEIDSLHTVYSALGFNHTGDKIHAEIMAKKAEL